MFILENVRKETAYSGKLYRGNHDRLNLIIMSFEKIRSSVHCNQTVHRHLIDIFIDLV